MMSEIKQKFDESNEDCKTYPFKTTSGKTKQVHLKMVCDDGSVSIELCSKGSYHLKIGYFYTAILDETEKENNETS
jgi:hypothetical protein